jgi:GT2 family glycosyltransferase
MIPGQVRVVSRKDNPVVSVIIPSLDGYRAGNVPKLIEDVRQQTIQEIEILIAQGFKPNSRARNEGAKKAHGQILIFIDDDVRLGHNKVIANLIAPFAQDTKIGLTGTYHFLGPEDSRFQKRCYHELFRYPQPSSELVESDWVGHICLAIPARLFKELGGENEAIYSGTDPELRSRIRQAGYRIVLVPNTWAYHPMPRDFRELVRMNFRAGTTSSRMAVEYPQLTYDIPAPGEQLVVKKRRALGYRIMRFAGQFLGAVISLQVIKIVSRLSYLAGYLYARFIRYFNPTAYQKIIR